jgi:Xaa-Pro aminopeptidase
MDHRARLKTIEQYLSANRLDAVLITHLANIRYLCGFTGSSGVLGFAHGEWAFFTDGRYTEQAKSEVVGARMRAKAKAPILQAAEWLAKRFRPAKQSARVAVEAENITLATQSRIKSELNSATQSKYRLVETTSLVEQFRIKKDSREVQQIRQAVQLASGIFHSIFQAIREGTTEAEVSAELERLARRAGAEKMSFETIVASGPHSAMPHARPVRQRIGPGFVIFDYGVILGGYCSDMTRTVHVGRAEDQARRVYQAVLEAQLAGIAAVRPGVEAQEVDLAARKVLRKYKLDKYFTHSLGHGVGIEIHEAPRLAKGQTQKLEAGMVVTIEPGVYIPGEGGVRIEDMVLVTANGCEVLTPTSKELVVL